MRVLATSMLYGGQSGVDIGDRRVDQNQTKNETESDGYQLASREARQAQRTYCGVKGLGLSCKRRPSAHDD